MFFFITVRRNPTTTENKQNDSTPVVVPVVVPIVAPVVVPIAAPVVVPTETNNLVEITNANERAEMGQNTQEAVPIPS